MSWLRNGLLGASIMTATMGGAWAQVVSPQTTSQSANSEIGKTADDARQAANKGNCIRFNILRNRLKAIRANASDPFWARHDLVAPGTANLLIVNTNARLDRAITELDQIECKPPVPAAQSTRYSSTAVTWMQDIDDRLEAERNARAGGVDMQMSGGGQMIRLPKRFMLGTEVGGVPNVFFFSPDREATGGSASGSVTVHTGADSIFAPINVHRLRFGGFYAESKVDQSGITLDPGVGVTLLIPGPNGGASGFALGANPLNIVRDGTYSAELVKAGGRVELGFGGGRAPGGVAASWMNGFDFHMAAGYKHISFDERFGGSIPGFARNFVYVSNVDVDQFNLRFGVTTRFTLASANGLTTTLGGMFEAGPDFSSGSGSDRLSFTGFSDSVRPLDASKTQFGFSGGLDLNFRTSTGLSFGVEGRYMRENGLPILVRDGNNPTALKLEDGDGWSARGYVRVNFRPPAP